MISRRSTGLGLLLLLALVASGCSGPSTPRDETARRVPLTIVKASGVAASDVLYLNAGPDRLNMQVIKVAVRSGRAEQLTKLADNQGVSTLHASGDHVVFACALLGRDHPYKLNVDATYEVLSQKPGFRPVVAPNGDVAWAEPAGEGSGARYKIHVLRAADSLDSAVFTSKIPAVAAGWLAGDRLAVFSGGETPQIQVLALGRKRVVRTIEVKPQKGFYFASTPAGDYAVGDGTEQTLIRHDGSRVRLASGWHPFTFSPDGTTLLVARQRTPQMNEIGFVAVSSPGTVTVWARLGLASLLDASWTSAGSPR